MYRFYAYRATVACAADASTQHSADVKPSGGQPSNRV